MRPSMGSESSPVEDQGSGMLVAATEATAEEVAAETAVVRVGDKVVVEVVARGDAGVTRVAKVVVVREVRTREWTLPLEMTARSRNLVLARRFSKTQ